MQRHQNKSKDHKLPTDFIKHQSLSCQMDNVEIIHLTIVDFVHWVIRGQCPSPSGKRITWINHVDTYNSWGSYFKAFGSFRRDFGQQWTWCSSFFFLCLVHFNLRWYDIKHLQSYHIYNPNLCKGPQLNLFSFNICRAAEEN